MVENGMFTWEASKVKGLVVVDIHTTRDRVSLDATSAQEMLMLQQEVISRFPNEVVCLLINAKGMQLDAQTLLPFMKSEEAKELISLSRQFNKLVVHSGLNAVRQIASALTFGQHISNIAMVKDRDMALNMVFEDAKSNASDITSTTTQIL